ncbi:MAG: deoxyhypusine synthase family protein, partial [Candidatus Hydrothermarchaeales archaeon]
MDRVAQIKIDRNSDITSVINEYRAAGVLGIGDLAKGVDIIEEMVKGGSTVFLGLAGPLVASGLRNIIADLIRDGLVQAVVSNGANLVHDLIEAFGGGHYKGAFALDDATLHDQGLGRIGNVLTKTSDFETFETRIQTMLQDMDEGLRENIGVAELTSELGKRVDDNKSLLKTAL